MAVNTPASARATAGNPEQARWFAEEVRPHEATLRGYLRREFPSVETDDIVQESYLKLLRCRSPGRIASVKAYLFSIARNTALTLFHRRRQLYSEIPVNELPGWQVLEGGPDAAEAANARQRLALVAEAVDTLPARCRAVMRLALVEGLSAIEIAAHLRLSENTVRVQLARGVHRCADHLRNLGEIP